MLRRERIFERDAWRCVYCGLVFPAEELTVDHVQPRMRGGDASEGNLVAACRGCNTRKGGVPVWQFLRDDPSARVQFFANARHVWPRLLRSIREAVEKGEGPRDD